MRAPRFARKFALFPSERPADLPGGGADLLALLENLLARPRSLAGDALDLRQRGEGEALDAFIRHPGPPQLRRQRQAQLLGGYELEESGTLVWTP